MSQQRKRDISERHHITPSTKQCSSAKDGAIQQSLRFLKQDTIGKGRRDNSGRRSYQSISPVSLNFSRKRKVKIDKIREDTSQRSRLSSSRLLNSLISPAPCIKNEVIGC
mmetsp:Transcript_26800/g.25840  ORF Transcript_26800/g.25840 Transcript_26800/m.25840 type:complete len:110 (+) Transcript_26800:142-471(+)